MRPRQSSRRGRSVDVIMYSDHLNHRLTLLTFLFSSEHFPSAFQNKVKDAEDTNAKLTLEKLEVEEVKTTAQKEMMALSKQQEEQKKEFTEKMTEVKVRLFST